MQFYKSHFWKHACFLSSKKRYFRFKIIIMAFKQYCCITLYYIVDNITKINTISSQNTKYFIYNYSNPTNKFIYICIHFVACACFCSHVTHVLFADVRRHTSARPDREEPRFQKKRWLMVAMEIGNAEIGNVEMFDKYFSGIFHKNP